MRIQRLGRIVLFGTLLLTGCAWKETVKNDVREASLPFKPRGTDHRDSTQDKQEDWSDYGKQARGDKKPDSENDPFRDWVMSPKARSIEQSLGYD